MMRARRWSLGALSLLLMASSGCSASADPPRALFVLPRGGDEAFFDLPWPTDVRRTDAGTIDVRGYVRQSGGLLGEYVQAITDGIDGYGTQASAYLRFSVSVDPASLPASGAPTLASDASAFLVDVDAASPERGARHPARIHYQDQATVYWPAHTLAVTPYPGLPLAPGRTYAAVVTRSVVAADGGPLVRDRDLEALVSGGGDATVEAARAIYGPALDALDAAGVPADEVLSLAVFTTTRQGFDEMMSARDWLVSSYPAPSADPTAFVYVGSGAGYDWVEGTYGPSPIFQEGTIPYLGGGGAIHFVGGAPQLVDTFQARFALSVPTSSMPASGYPVVIYGHGTGGDYRSIFSSGVAQLLAARGVAVLGTDEIHHGARIPAGVDPELAVFNVLNPQAFRDNVRQSALDLVQEARLIGSLTVPDGLVAGRTGIAFDTGRLAYYGHSQGGLNGPLFLAADDSVDRAVLSGTGATLSISLVEKTDPFSIAQLALTLASVSTSAEAEGWMLEHPIPCLLQTWMEAADTANYAPWILRRPRPGFAPKSILQTEGLADTYAPPHSLEAFATATGIPLLDPVLADVPGLTLRGLTTEAAPVTGNLAGGAATGGLLQFTGDHFVAFDPPATDQIAGFLASPAAPPTLPAAP